MKNIFKTMLPILAMAACVWASCSDDKDDPTPGKPALPTIAVSEPALSADNAKAVVTVTPSEETEKWYWKCEPKGQSAAAYTAVTGKEEAKLEIPIDMDVTLRNQLVAEAKFFRAMMYFDLIRMLAMFLYANIMLRVLRKM